MRHAQPAPDRHAERVAESRAAERRKARAERCRQYREAREARERGK